MKRHHQDLNDLLEQLSAVETDWQDAFSEKTIAALRWLNGQADISLPVLADLLKADFEVGLTVFRLFLEKSKDEFTVTLRDLFGSNGSAGKKMFLADPERFVQTLDQLGIRDRIKTTIHRSYTWEDILFERLKAGRGSAIKGQARGRQMENFVEEIVRSVFGDQYHPRCSFTGKTGLTTAKADFAIPSRENPSLVIEVKAFGATGSKQSNVIGDVEQIIREKRRDTLFFLVTDGVTWRSRINDFRKLVKFQNEGDIYRIYNQRMGAELEMDMRLVKERYL